MTNVDQIKHTAKGIVVNQIDRRTTDLGNFVGGHVNNLRDMSDSLRSQGQDATAQFVGMAADRLSQVSTYLTQTDGDRMIHDIETIARTQPMITAAAGFVVGVTAARLLKAGAAHRYQTYGETSGRYRMSYEDTIASEEIDYGVR